MKSKEEAIEWVKRAPFQDEEIEIRQVFEAEDFGDEFTPELREQEQRIPRPDNVPAVVVAARRRDRDGART